LDRTVRGPLIYERPLLFLLFERTPLGLRRFSLLRRHSAQCGGDIRVTRASCCFILARSLASEDPLEAH
jgi:hypothetical protein